MASPARFQGALRCRPLRLPTIVGAETMRTTKGRPIQVAGNSAGSSEACLCRLHRRPILPGRLKMGCRHIGCSMCGCQYEQSERGRATRLQYRNSRRGRAMRQRYQRSKRGRAVAWAAHQRYVENHRAEHLKRHREYMREWRLKRRKLTRRPRMAA